MTDWAPLKTTILAMLLSCTAALAQQPQHKAAQPEKRPPPRSSTCLDLVEKAENEHQPEIKLAPKLADLGDAYRREGATMEAIPVYERALGIYKKSRQSSSTRALDCQMALADVFEDSGRYDKSVLVYNEALTNAGASQHYQVEILPSLATVMVKSGKTQAAEPIFKRALGVTEKHYGPVDPHVAQVLLGYADLLGKLNRRAEAEKLTARAKTILDRKPGAPAGGH